MRIHPLVRGELLLQKQVPVGKYGDKKNAHQDAIWVDSFSKLREFNWKYSCFALYII